jgi:large subunit ribosomal protein L10
MRDAGASYKVSKNRLAKRLKDTQYEGLEDTSRPDRACLVARPIAAQGHAVEFAKTNDKLEIVGRPWATRSSMPKGQGARRDAFNSTLRANRGPGQCACHQVVQLVNAAKLARVFGAYGAKEAA